MGGELDAREKTWLEVGEKTWLEVVKAAAIVEQNDLYAEEHGLYPSIIKPSWIRQLNDLEDETDGQSGLSEIPTPLLLIGEEELESSQAFPSIRENEEQVLIKVLKDLLVRSNGLSKQSFFGVLGPYLLGLKARQHEAIAAKGKSRGRRRSIAVVEGNDEQSTLSLLEDTSKFLGQRIVVLIIECCISLNFWAPVQVLLECRVVVSSSSSQLVQSLIEGQQPLILCLYIANVPDLNPQDVYSMLTYFLDSTTKPSTRCFQLVRREWRKVAEVEIEKAGKCLRGWGHQNAVSSAIGLAMAVDGFSSPELCIHYLLAAGQDEGVLSSVVGQLSTLQVFKLTQYLGRWMEQYCSYLENFPAPRNDRVPSFAQILSWAGVILEGHFTQFVLSPDFHDELRSMRGLVQSLVMFGTKICPLSGIAEHIISQNLLPGRKRQGGAAADYVIELVDMT